MSKRTTTAPIDARTTVSKNWYTLSVVTVLSTLGMAVAVAPLLAERIGAVWPWPNTHIVLLGGLVISVAMLIFHLTRQQQRVATINHQVRLMEEDGKARQQQNDARLQALLNLSRVMGAVTDPENVFRHITESCLEIFECHQASLMLLNQDKTELEVKASTGHRTDVTGRTQKVGSGIAGWVAKNQEPLILDGDTDMTRYPDLHLNSKSVTAAMVVPILLRGELVGVLNASSRSQETRYSEDDLRSLSVFAENAGTVIRHSEQALWMRQTIERLRAQVEKLQSGQHQHT
jgi:GAF domain-containing protein